MSPSPHKPSKSNRRSEEHQSSGDTLNQPESSAKQACESAHPDPSSLELHRPRRPSPAPEVSPASPEPAVAEPPPPEEIDTSDIPELAGHGQQPIPPPSEPMQYRAIGLIQGKYQPAEEQFNRGTLLTADEVPLDAVLLGQVISLVKKYVDLEQSYVWVVYPRTRDKEETLHVQIVGVWSPEGFGPVTTDSTTELPTEISPEDFPLVPLPELVAPLQDGYFSIRGEVVQQAPEDSFVLVKIQQAPRKTDDRPKAFKVKLSGVLSTKATGYFWDFHVQREGESLVIRDGTSIGLIPPKRRAARKSNASGHSSHRKSSQQDVTTPKPPKAFSKPIKRTSRSADS